MTTIQKHRLLIMGSGPAALSAAIYAARAELNPIVVTGSPIGGQLMRTHSVKNWPGEQDISGADLVEKLMRHAVASGAHFITDTVTRLVLSPEEKQVHVTSGEIFHAAALIIACGGKPKTLECAGAKEFAGKGIFTSLGADDTHTYENKAVTIVGGGNSAITFAARLLEAGARVTLVQALGKLTATDQLIHRVQNHPCATVLCNHTVSAVNGTQNGVTDITVISTLSQEKITLPTSAVFVAIGAGPNTDLFKGQLLISQTGHLVVHPGTTLTSMAGVFAAGDVADNRYRHAITSAGQGCMAALDAERYLTGTVITRFN